MCLASAKLAQASSYGGQVPKKHKEGKFQCASSFQPLLSSYFLMSHWSKQVTWPSPDTRDREIDFNQSQCGLAFPLYRFAENDVGNLNSWDLKGRRCKILWCVSVFVCVCLCIGQSVLSFSLMI